MSIFSRYIILALLVCFTALNASPCPGELLQSKKHIKYAIDKTERIYFDPDDFPMGEESFHIHVGGNEWIQTTTVHRDITGFFTYSVDVYCVPGSVAYERHWKCPYCNLYWPWGSPCGNAQCPGKF